MVKPVALSPESVVARYKAAGLYQKPFVKLVSFLNKWEALANDGGLTTKALEALDAIEKLVKEDKEGILSALPGMDSDAPQQHIDELRNDLHKAQRAAKVVLDTYDAMNASFLRMGLK